MKKGDRFIFNGELYEFKHDQVDYKKIRRATCYTVKDGKAGLPMVSIPLNELENVKIIG